MAERKCERCGRDDRSVSFIPHAKMAEGLLPWCARCVEHMRSIENVDDRGEVREEFKRAYQRSYHRTRRVAQGLAKIVKYKIELEAGGEVKIAYRTGNGRLRIWGKWDLRTDAVDLCLTEFDVKYSQIIVRGKGGGSGSREQAEFVLRARCQNARFTTVIGELEAKGEASRLPAGYGRGSGSSGPSTRDASQGALVGDGMTRRKSRSIRSSGA